MAMSCPTNETEWRRRSVNCADDSYHCTIDQYDNLVDSCVDPIWIETGKCPLYNTEEQTLTSVTCDSTEPTKYPCPQTVYKSNQVFKYAACTNYNSRRSDGDAKSSPKSTSTMTSQNTTISAPVTSPCGPACLGAVISVLLILVIIAVCAALYVFWKRNRGQNQGLLDVCQVRCHSKKRGKRQQNTDDREQTDVLLQDPIGETQKDDVLASKGNGVVEPELDPWKQFQQSFQINFDEHYETPLVAKLSQCLRDRDAIAVVGPWGSGKTTVTKQAIHRCAQDFRGNSCVFKTISDIECWDPNIQEDCVSFIHLKDIIKDWYTLSFVEETVLKLNDMISSCRGKSWIVVTIRDKVWEKFKDILSKCVLFTAEKLLDLSQKDTITSQDLREILSKHLEVNNVEVGVSENICVSDKTVKAVLGSSSAECVIKSEKKIIGIPEMISLACKNRRMLSNMSRFCSNPVQVIRHDLKQMSESPKQIERCKFVVLSYAMMNNGSFSTDNLDEDLLRSLRSSFSVFSPPQHYFSDALDELLGEYIDAGEDRKTYRVQHEVIVRIILIVVAHVNLKLVLQKCHALLLLDCVRPDLSSLGLIKNALEQILYREEKNLEIYVEKESYDDILQRFKALENEPKSNIKNHIFLQDIEFQRLWMV